MGKLNFIINLWLKFYKFETLFTGKTFKKLHKLNIYLNILKLMKILIFILIFVGFNYISFSQERRIVMTLKLNVRSGAGISYKIINQVEKIAILLPSWLGIKFWSTNRTGGKQT